MVSYRTGITGSRASGVEGNLQQIDNEYNTFTALYSDKAEVDGGCDCMK